MVDISFIPTFEHREFVDLEDRVRAGEPNGFNGRFNAIESDLRRLSEVFAEVDTALGGTGGDTVQRRITLPPRQVQFGASKAWTVGSHGEASAAPGSTAAGIQRLILPDGVRLRSLRVFGQAAGAAVTVVLSRVPIGDGAAQVLTTVSGDANPFDRSAAIPANLSVTTTGAFRYLIQASVPAVPGGGVAIIAAFQITYTLR